MNKLQVAMGLELAKAGKMTIDDHLEYLGTGSIIAFSNVREDKVNCDLHGSLPAKLYVIIECIMELAREYDTQPEEVVDAIKFVISDDEPFEG